MTNQNRLKEITHMTISQLKAEINLGETSEVLAEIRSYLNHERSELCINLISDKDYEEALAKAKTASRSFDEQDWIYLAGWITAHNTVIEFVNSDKGYVKQIYPK